LAHAVPFSSTSDLDAGRHSLKLKWRILGMKKFAYGALVLTLALIALPNGAMAATKTRDNLQAGFNGDARRRPCDRQTQ
jgi:hypothetical protein